MAVVVQVSGDWLREKIEQEHNRALIEQALEHVFGQPLKLRCRVGGAQGGSAPSGADDDLLTQDSLAAYAVNELGGQVKRAKNKEENAS